MAGILFLSSSLLESAASASAETLEQPKREPLEQLKLGNGRWKPLNEPSSIDSTTISGWATPMFTAYLTRFLLQYDEGVHQWWDTLQQNLALVSPSERRDKANKAFSELARSMQQGLVLSNDALWDLLTDTYGTLPDAKRHISLLFALLPPEHQPLRRLRAQLSSGSSSSTLLLVSSSAADDTLSQDVLVDSFSTDLTALLPPPFHVELAPDGLSAVIVPDALGTTLLTNPLDDDPGLVVKSDTPFGSLAASPLIRELPAYSPLIYTLFGVSGATGCALTHAVVIPLDVVKTRAQTDPLEEGTNMVGAAVDIVQKEGVQALLLGAQATIAGYFWYGLSVYPSYTFFKRYISLEMLPPDVSMAHVNDIALIAGALAAVVASLGLTPIEAARIRVVAEPNTYRPLGLFGTLQAIAQEDPALGWKTWYAGLNSLLARQVIFGSVKFLAFERACEFIYAVWPFLRDLTWTNLTVSLVAGGFSGALSSVVSQPADSLLTFVAQNSNGTSSKEGGATMGLLEGCQIMIEREGPGSLFRGLGSRCVWAGSIIAGQFLLYDVFRTYFHVSSADLSQAYEVVVATPSLS